MGRMLEGVVIIKRDPGNYRQHLIYPHLEFPCGVQNTRSAGRPPTCPRYLFKVEVIPAPVEPVAETHSAHPELLDDVLPTRQL